MKPSILIIFLPSHFLVFLLKDKNPFMQEHSEAVCVPGAHDTVSVLGGQTSPEVILVTQPPVMILATSRQKNIN